MPQPTKPLRAIIWCAVSTTAQAADEKESLPTQEREAQTICEARGWDVVDILRVPGHSRDYYTLAEAAAHARTVGMDAFDRLIEHIERKDFDMFVVRDATRFGRSQSLTSEVAEKIVLKVGAAIYSWSNGGMIDASTVRGFIALSGYSAAVEMDNLRSRQQVGFAGRTKRGLPTNQMLPFSHLMQRDPQTGKGIGIVLDESKRRLFEDFATLLLEGVSWRNIERDLYERFGHVRPDGTPHRKYAFYHVVHNPYFWGHAARNHKNQKLPNGQKTDMWVFDSNFPIPEGVTIQRDNHEPVYMGELAERVKAELRRRRMVIRGSALPSRTHKFTGLLVCGHCGFNMVYSAHRHSKSAMYICHSKYDARSRPGCETGRSFSEAKVQIYLDVLLRRMLELQDVDLGFQETVENPAHRADMLLAEIKSAEDQIRRLITKQATAPGSVAQLYDEQISALGEQLVILKSNLAKAQRETYEHRSDNTALALSELALVGLENFWSCSDTHINQLLHRLFRFRRIIVENKNIVGIMRLSSI